MWFNLVAMCVFLAHKASGVVFAILETFGRRPDAARANGREDSADEAWVEGRLVLSAFEPSRPVRHSREGHGIAIAVVDSQKDMAPYLICFKSGLAKWCVLQPAPQSLLFGTCTFPALTVFRFLVAQVQCNRACVRCHRPARGDSCMGAPFRRKDTSCSTSTNTTIYECQLHVHGYTFNP